MKLRPLDKINISLRYLEKTSAEFNPAIKIDDVSTKSPISMGTEEMTQRAMELATALGINNIQQYAERTIHPTPSAPSTNEEST